MSSRSNNSLVRYLGGVVPSIECMPIVFMELQMQVPNHQEPWLIGHTGSLGFEHIKSSSDVSDKLMCLNGSQLEAQVMSVANHPFQT